MSHQDVCLIEYKFDGDQGIEGQIGLYLGVSEVLCELRNGCKYPGSVLKSFYTLFFWNSRRKGCSDVLILLVTASACRN